MNKFIMNTVQQEVLNRKKLEQGNGMGHTLMDGEIAILNREPVASFLEEMATE